MLQHGCKYFARRPTDLGMGTIGQNSTFFSENVHVAYQIKGKYEYSKTLANILSADQPHPDPGEGFNRPKFNFFRTWSYCISN